MDEQEPLTGGGNGSNSREASSSSYQHQRQRRGQHQIDFLGFSISELGLGILVLVAVIIPFFSSFFIIPPGEIGIVVTLGHVKSYRPGPHWRIPFLSHLVLMSSKTQKLDEQNNVPTQEGLSVQLDTAV